MTAKIHRGYFVAIASVLVLGFVFHSAINDTKARATTYSTGRKELLKYPPTQQKTFSATKQSDLPPSSQTIAENSKEFNTQLNDAKVKALDTFREWEKSNTLYLSFLDDRSGDHGKNTNFLLPQINSDVIAQIANQSAGEKNKKITEQIIHLLEQFAGRPVQKFRYLKLEVGQSASLDRLTYLDLDDKKSFVVDPVSGKINIIGNSMTFGLLENYRGRYDHLFKIME
jgi:hypothetical protein